MSILDDKSYLLSKFNIVDFGQTDEAFPVSYDKYDHWVEEGHSRPLNYLSDERKKIRQDLRHYFPEFKSALVFLFSYGPAKKYLNSIKSKQKISSYVFSHGGADYHIEIKKTLDEILKELQKENSELIGKAVIDTAPILERDLAYRAGLGWFGKNSMLISRTHGSYFFIGSLLLNQPLEREYVAKSETDHCGTCLACVQACPTNAIDPQTRTLFTHKCISTFTIEMFKAVSPPAGYLSSNGEIFGCDICQEVCPWNSKQDFSQRPFVLNENGKDLLHFFLERDVDQIILDLEGMSSNKFKKLFKNTALERTGRIGLIKNLIPFKK